MAIPKSSDARLYYRCALQRHEEAEVLLEAGYTTGAVYLAGYGIECILKSLILASVTDDNRPEVLQSFRGGKAHDYEWLREVYRENGGARFPRDVNQQFTLVNDWSTDLRYTPSIINMEDAEAFLKAGAAIIGWANGRL